MNVLCCKNLRQEHVLYPVLAALAAKCSVVPNFGFLSHSS